MDVKDWAEMKRAQIITVIDDLLRQAHSMNMKYNEAREWVITHVRNNILEDTSTPDSVISLLRSGSNKDKQYARKIVGEMVDNAIEERKKDWEKDYRTIMKSGKPPDQIKKDREHLESLYFTREDVDKMRKAREEDRKKRKEFEEDVKKERRKVLGEEAKERREGIYDYGDDTPWEKEGFGDLSLGERERLREEWYKKRRKDLKKRYKEKKISREEFKRELGRGKAVAYGEVDEGDYDRYMELKGKKKKGRTEEEKEEFKELKKEMRGSRLKRAARGANRFASAPGKFAKGAQSLVMKGFILAVFVGIGAVATVAIGLPWQFFVAFLAWGLFYLLPDPNDIKIPDQVKDLSEDNPLRWNMLNPFSAKGTYVRNSHTGWGTLRSIVKISVFGLFIWGIYTSAIPLGNIALIILAFFGYYSLKITYDVDKPYELIESLMRFAGLGFFFIPWIIMYGIFDSMLLAFIAMAFFAIPPIPRDRKSSELMAMYDFYDKIIFAIIMIGVLIGFFAGWEVSSTLSATFIYFWFVTAIAGFFSPAEARPAMGFLMLGAATIIYGIGPGTQETMSALFGPWWPTIQNTFSSITEPIGEAFGGFSNTLRGGWLLLTNPVGYATQLMNGTHASNPTGKTGALGIQITDITISPIFPEQPFLITTMIKNEGSLDAENVIIYLSTGYEPPKERKPSPLYGPLLLFIPKAHRPDVLQMSDMFNIEEKNILKCHEDEEGGIENGCQNTLEKQYVWQETFTSDEGISCDIIESYKLREKAIPVKVSVTYNYSSHSTVDVEFMSKNEWTRLAESNQLSQRLRFVLSQYSTAPVEFPIGTPGLKNPILAGQPFHLGMRIESGNLKGEIETVKEIILIYPEDFELNGECTPSGESANVDISGFRGMRWVDLPAGPKVFYCPFKGLTEDKLTGPTKTYVVKAFANYSYTIWKEKSTKIEFGGKCCSDDDCLTGQECANGMCVVKGTSVPGDCDFEPSNRIQFEEIPKYHNEIRSALQKHSISNMDSSYAAEALVAAVINKESSWNPNTKTPEPNVNDYSFGLMQIRFDTAKGMGFPFKTSDTADNYPCDPSKPDNLCYPALNIQYGTKYLAERRASAATLQCTISNYNAGSGCPMGTNSNNCKYVKSVMEYYYRYYFFYDYCGWHEKQGLGKCQLGGGGCTGTSQCDISTVYGPEDGTKKAPICRTDLKPHVCCPPEDIMSKSECQSAYSEFKSQ